MSGRVEATLWIAAAVVAYVFAWAYSSPWLFGLALLLLARPAYLVAVRRVRG